MIPDSSPIGFRGVAAGSAAAFLLCALSTAALDPSRAVTQYHRQVWSAHQGLPNNSVNWLAQDADGYLIVGTFGGNVLFDGFRFQPLGGAFDSATGYARTPDGTGWFVGHAIVRRGPDGVVADGPSTEAIGNILATHVDPDGSLLLGGANGLGRIDRGSSTIVLEQGIEGRVTSIMRDRQGVLYVGTDRGLYQQSLDGRWASVIGTEDQIVTHCLEVRDGSIWLGTNHGVMVLHPDGRITRHTESIGPPSGSIRALLEDRDGNVWVGTAANGVARFAGEKAELLGNEKGLPSASIRSLLEDADGNIWIATAGGGLARLSNSHFLSLTTTEGLRSNSVFNVLRGDGGDLWVGTNGGGLSHFRNGELVRNYGPEDGLSDPVVQATLETREGRFIVGTRSGVYTLQGSRFQRVKPLDGLLVRYLEEDSNGNVLVGSDEGLVRWSGARIERFDPPDDRPAQIRTIEPARSGGYWMGGYGLAHFDGTSLTYIRPERFNESIRDIHEDRDGVLWIATPPGIVRLDGEELTEYEVPAAIDRVVHAIVPDNNRRFWLPTNAGLVRAERDQLVAVALGKSSSVDWTTFSESDGLPGGEFSGSFGRSWARGRGGRLWFASVAGAVSVDPTTEFIPHAIPATLELARTDDGRRIRNRENLSPQRRRRIAFQYTAINLSTPEQTRFRYRLEPLDVTWVEAGEARDAVYRNLGPGSYRFRVEAAGRDGVFRADPRPFHLSIAPYFYERTPVRFAAAVLLIGAAISVLLLRERRLLRRQDELQHVVNEKTRALTKANAELELVSRTDTLTGLLNRRDFDERAENEIARVNRGHGAFSVLLVDVDHFKRINDSFGHATGDLLLAHVAGVLGERTRRQDLIGRWAGEEFILLLPDTTLEGAALLAEKIRWSIEHGDYSAYGGPEHLTATFGVTAFQAGETLEEAVRRTELALDEGKASGRNRVVGRSATEPEERTTSSED